MKINLRIIFYIFFLLALPGCRAQTLQNLPQTTQAAQPGLQPQEITQAFYDDWIDQANQRFMDEGPNALAERSYHQSPYLTEGLIEAVDQQLNAELSLGGGDPFLCAQDIPVQIETVSAVLFPPEAAGPVLPPSARVLLKTSFDNHYLTTRLVKENELWKIDHISCNLTPEGTVEAFYTWYLGATSNPNSEYFHNPIQEGTFRTIGFLSPKLIDDIDAIVATFENQAGYDPFLQAQNTPLDFYVEPAVENNTVLVHQVWGTQIQTLKIVVIENKGRWQLDTIEKE